MSVLFGTLRCNNSVRTHKISMIRVFVWGGESILKNCWSHAAARKIFSGLLVGSRACSPGKFWKYSVQDKLKSHFWTLLVAIWTLLVVIYTMAQEVFRITAVSSGIVYLRTSKRRVSWTILKKSWKIISKTLKPRKPSLRATWTSFIISTAPWKIRLRLKGYRG